VLCLVVYARTGQPRKSALLPRHAAQEKVVERKVQKALPLLMQPFVRGMCSLEASLSRGLTGLGTTGVGVETAHHKKVSRQGQGGRGWVYSFWLEVSSYLYCIDCLSFKHAQRSSKYSLRLAFPSFFCNSVIKGSVRARLAAQRLADTQSRCQLAKLTQLGR
jgi:hypothetical protein